MVSISLDEIEAVTCSALKKHGASAFSAAEVARAVRKAESVGNRICGLYYVESYCQQLQTGRVKGDVLPDVSSPRPGVVQVDARFGFAQPAFAYGLPVALDTARACGHRVAGRLSRPYLHSAGVFHRTDRARWPDRDRIYQCFAHCGPTRRQKPDHRDKPDRLFGAGCSGWHRHAI